MENSSLSYTRKYPIIIPAKSDLAVLMVRDAHEMYFHAGAKFIKAFLGSKYWFVGGLTNISKRIVQECVVCRRFKAKAVETIMSQLPSDRVTPSKPFFTPGVDLAGPMWAKCVGHRSTVKFKIYAAIFVCFATKAVHIEVVSALSSECFLETLQRFISCCGIPKVIWSDHGTNFVGVQNYIKVLTELSAKKSIAWKFIPPQALHHGGLREAAVKSAKFHLVRAIGVQPLSFEEYCTFFYSY